MTTSSVVLTGVSGMLGSAFRARLSQVDVVCLGRFDLDVSQPEKLKARIQALQPAVLINCAADTNVEATQDDPCAAYTVNALLPELLAQACRAASVRLVHFSSTGCYGAGRDTPYSDYDTLRPTTVHHQAKAAGEAAVREAGAQALILRLGWLYGGATDLRKNFVMDRIREARSKSELSADPSQRGNPTWVEDVVSQTLVLLDAGLLGTYNCVSMGSATRLEYVQRIVDLAGLHTTLLPRRFERKAPVSPNESARNDKLTWLGLNRMPAWEDALARYVDHLMASEQSP